MHRGRGQLLVLVSCDHFWSNLYGIQYAFCDGKCYGSVRCGWSCLDLGYVSTSPSWIIGACDLFWCHEHVELMCVWVGEFFGSTLVGGGLFTFEIGDILRYWDFVGACDQYWPNYGFPITLASCGGDIRYMVGHIGSLCLCLQFRAILAEYTLGAY